MLGGEGGGEDDRGYAPERAKTESMASMASLVKRLVAGDASASVSIREAVQGRGPSVRSLMAADGIPALCDALKSRPSKRLLDSLLSTVGDCSLDSEFRDRIAERNVSSDLVFLIKHTTEDNIVRKCCRVVGNLALNDENCKQLHSEGIVAILRNILEDDKLKVSTPTLTSAVRAIRILWTPVDSQKDMVQSGIVGSVFNLFHARCMKAEIMSKTNISKNVKSDIFTGLLKCIGYFTINPTLQCVEQIVNNEQVFRCLVILTKVYDNLALQSIINLCYIEQCQPLLGAAGAVQLLIDNLKSRSDWPSSWVKALSLLCRAPVNRMKFIDHGGIALLLNIIQTKDPSKLSCHLYALQTLLLFYYNVDALKILTEDGAIKVFIKQLKEYVELMDYEHQCDTDVKKEKLTSDEQNYNDGLILENNDDTITRDDEDISENTLIDSIRDNWDSDEDTCSPLKKMKCEDNSEPKVKTWLSSKHQSPNLSPCSDYSSANASSLSPEYHSRGHKNCVASTSSGCSPGSPSSSTDGHISSFWNPCFCGTFSSPSSASPYEDSVDSDWSAHYSPVCSDEDDNLTISSMDMDCTSETHMLVDAYNDLVNDGSLLQESLKDSNINQTYSFRILGLLSLLHVITYYSNGSIIKMTTRDLLFTLINYIKKCKYSSKNIAVKIFNRILSYNGTLRHLLKHSVVLTLYDTMQKPKHEKCKQCRQITKLFSKFNLQISNMAESDYGVGIISNQLLCEESSIKENLVLTLPFITRSTRVLKKFFMTCDALEHFLTILSARKKPLEHCVPALAKLATNLAIPPPKPLFGKFKSFTSCQYEPVVDEENKVVFVLDDSSVVSANMKLLCNNSDVFVAMLHGVFKEAHQKYVRLQEVSRESLEYLFVLLEAGVHLKPIENFPLPKTIHIALETLLLTDRFLMDKIKDLLFSAIVQFKLDMTTADKIYVWSLKEGMGTLCMESVAYTLVGEMSNDERCCIVISIMDSIYKEQWIDDIRCSLLRFML